MSHRESAVGSKTKLVQISRAMDYLLISALFLILLAAYHMHALYTMGDWDLWTDWKDRRFWVTVAPIVLIAFPAAVQVFFWEKFRLPFGATFVVLGLLFGEWVNRYFNAWGLTSFPINFVWPTSLIPMALALDIVLLMTGNFIATAIIGGLAWGLLLYPTNWAHLAAFHLPVNYHGIPMSLADVQGYQYVRTRTPEYLRYIEKGTLRTFGRDVAPVSAFFAAFISMLVYFLWYFIGKWFCTTRYLLVREDEQQSAGQERAQRAATEPQAEAEQVSFPPQSEKGLPSEGPAEGGGSDEDKPVNDDNGSGKP